MPNGTANNNSLAFNYMDQLTQNFLNLVNVNSHTNNVAGVNQIGAMVKELLKDMPLDWQEFAPQGDDAARFGNMLYAKSQTWDSAKPGIILCGHLDTVFPTHEGFDIRVEGDIIYGPGTADMKGGLLVMIEAIKKLHSEGKLSNVGLLFIPEEEQMKLERFPQMAEICKDISYLMVYESGASHGEVIPNHKEKNLVVSRKGFLGYTMKFKAAGGHSGGIARLTDRHSAVHELLQQSDKIINAANYEIGTTTNVGVISGGTASNALAQEAEMKFDGRLPNRDEYERVKGIYDKLAEQKFDNAVEIELTCNTAVYPLTYSDHNKEFFQRAQRVAAGLGMSVFEESRGGGSDANRLIYYAPNLAILDNFGPIGYNDHTTEEYAFLSSIPVNVNLSCEIIKDVLA